MEGTHCSDSCSHRRVKKRETGLYVREGNGLVPKALKNHIIRISDYVYWGITFLSSRSLFNISLKPCSQCPGASLPATEINLPGLLPLMPRNSPLRGMSISGGLQNLMHGHDIFPSNMDEAQPHYTYKCECDILLFQIMSFLLTIIVQNIRLRFF